MGTPLARLFLEPQNTMVISSSFEAQAARQQRGADEGQGQDHGTHQQQAQQRHQGMSFHRPWITAALKAV
jgi:hypothetical protein